MGGRVSRAPPKRGAARFAGRPPFGVPIFLHCLMVSAQLYGLPAQAHLAFSWVPWGTHEKQGVPRDVSKDPPTANLAHLFLSGGECFIRGDFFFRGDLFEKIFILNMYCHQKVIRDKPESIGNGLTSSGLFYLYRPYPG